MSGPNFTLKGDRLDGSGPGLISLSGSFDITASAVTNIRPKLGNFKIFRRSAGVYVVQYVQATISIVSSVAQIGPAVGVTTGALPTATPADAMASKDFLDASATNFVQDATKTKMLILVTASGALVDVPSHYRCSFDFVLAASAINF